MSHHNDLELAIIHEDGLGNLPHKTLATSGQLTDIYQEQRY